MRRRVVVAAFVVFSLHCFGQSSSNPTFSEQWDSCIPSPNVKAALDTLPEQTRGQTEWDILQQKLAVLERLRHQFSGNVFVERRYLLMMLGNREHEQIIEESEAKFKANPDNPLLAYLYGLSLLGRRSSESERLFEDALRKDPKFPWPHLELDWLYSSPGFRDKQKSDTHLRAFLNECPEAFEGYEQLSRSASDDKELIQESASRLRSVLGSRTDADVVAAYQTLWALEFKAAPTSEYASLREKVQRDVARIRALHMEEKRQWYDTLEQGYRLTNDLKDSEWAKNERDNRYPSVWGPASLGKWFDDHPSPANDASVETRRTYNQGLLAETGNWIRDYPNSTFIWGMRLDALAELDSVTPQEIEQAADQFIGVAQKNAGPIGPGSSEYFRVVRALSKKHLQPERVIEMAGRGLRVSETEEKDQLDDLLDADDATEFRFYTLSERLKAMAFMAKAQLAVDRGGEAEITVSRMDERLQDMKSLVADKNDRQQSYLEQVSVYWECMARLAQSQRRNVDAMGFYENALLRRLEAKQKPIPGEKDELAEDARQLWSMLGGTNGGWMMWYGRRANELAQSVSLTWENANEPLPDFKLTDLNGKVWTQESLKGKVTFLNFWASW